MVHGEWFFALQSGIAERTVPRALLACYRRDARMVNFLRGKFGFLLAKSYL